MSDRTILWIALAMLVPLGLGLFAWLLALIEEEARLHREKTALFIQAWKADNDRRAKALGWPDDWRQREGRER